jgi:hypothetical protein
MTAQAHLRSAIAIAVAIAAACGGGGDAGDGGGPPCGVRGGTECPADQYCDFPQNSCGTADEPGQCVPRPSACPPLLVPELTCGCDGKVYGSACDAQAAGADLNALGTCAPDARTFGCGYRLCSLTTEYCERRAGDPAGAPEQFSCPRLPGCPGGASCACLASQPCGSQCSGSPRGGFTLVCAPG